MKPTVVVAALALTCATLSAAPSSAAAAPTCWGATATLVGTPGDDVLTGTPGRDVIAGLGGNDVIDDVGGLDLVCGGSGADSITVPKNPGPAAVSGGSGDDHIVSRARQTTLDAGPGDDVESVDSRVLRYFPETGTNQLDVAGTRLFLAHFSTVTSALRADLIAGLFTFVGSHTTVGSAAGIESWSIYGTDEADTILGSDGPDFVRAGASDDVVRGRGGDDRVSGQQGADVVRGGSGDDRLHGGRGPDVLDGGPGHDTGDANGGKDTCISMEGPLESGGHLDCEVTR